MRPFGSAEVVSLVSGFEVRDIQAFVVEMPDLKLSLLGRLWPVLHTKPLQNKTSRPVETKKGRALRGAAPFFRQSKQAYEHQLKL